MRKLQLSGSNDDHKTIFLRLVQALNFQPNQGGDESKQRELVALKKLFETNGRKYKIEVRNAKGGIELADGTELTDGDHEIVLDPEARWDQLKECWKAFAQAGGCQAEDAILVYDYLKDIPAIDKKEAEPAK